MYSDICHFQQLIGSIDAQGAVVFPVWLMNRHSCWLTTFYLAGFRVAYQQLGSLEHVPTAGQHMVLRGVYY